MYPARGRNVRAVSIALAVAVSLSASGCATHASKKQGYITGAVLVVAGAAVLAGTRSLDCNASDNPTCAFAGVAGYGASIGLLAAGALTLLTTATR